MDILWSISNVTMEAFINWKLRKQEIWKYELSKLKMAKSSFLLKKKILSFINLRQFICFNYKYEIPANR